MGANIEFLKRCSNNKPGMEAILSTRDQKAPKCSAPVIKCHIQGVESSLSIGF